jgi:hypothetical protein
MRAATGETRDGAPDFADAREIARAVRTFVEETPNAFANRKRQIVTTLFVGNSQIATGFAPF